MPSPSGIYFSLNYTQAQCRKVRKSFDSTFFSRTELWIFAWLLLELCILPFSHCWAFSFPSFLSQRRHLNPLFASFLYLHWFFLTRVFCLKCWPRGFVDVLLMDYLFMITLLAFFVVLRNTAVFTDFPKEGIYDPILQFIAIIQSFTRPLICTVFLQVVIQ